MVSPDTAGPLAVLRQADAPLAAVSELDKSTEAWPVYKVGIAANVTVDLLSLYLRRYGYLAGVRLQVDKGHYDDVLGDLTAFRGQSLDLVLVLPFFDNLQPNWEVQLVTCDEGLRQGVLGDYLARLDLALQATAGIGQVVVLGSHLRDPQTLHPSQPAQTLADFHAGLAACVARHANARMLPLEGLFQQIGSKQALDARFYYRAKSPYTPKFLDALAQRVVQDTRGFGTRFHKVLVLDCDNTLWGGVIGEDGMDGIQLDSHGFPGNVFHHVQHQFSALEQQGVLLCLCSKNNEADALEAFHHKAMVLQRGQIVAYRINWEDKPSNLKALATQLNLGLDSFVFIDDSAFEVTAVREQLPQVAVFQVPKALHEYPALIRDQVMPLFLTSSNRASGQSKTQQYQALAQAQALQANFASQEDYLRNLQLAVDLRRNDKAQASRIAELMAKSNQFNLTTLRLPLGEVLARMEQGDGTVYSFSVSDRLTAHGLTGVLITRDDGDAVEVQAFLMSCRVIGRGVEFSVWAQVASDALARGKRQLKAAYLPSAKNAQVADFYDRLGMQRVREADDGSRHYEAVLDSSTWAPSDWVEVRNGG